jgi:hypothetical protein
MVDICMTPTAVIAIAVMSPIFDTGMHRPAK